MKTLVSSLEPLEARIAPAAIFTFTDIDGDKGTIKTSKGTKADLSAILTFSDADPTHARQLRSVDFSQNAAVFAGTDLTVTAAHAGTGDGLVNVGLIEAGVRNGGTPLDLGNVRIGGDLGAIDAGDGVSATSAIKVLTVASLGRFGTATGAPDLHSSINGKLGALKVSTSVQLAYIGVTDSGGGGQGGIGSIAIGGSLIGGADTNSGSIFATGDIGAVKIGGNIEGGSGPQSGLLSAGGALKSVNLAGSVYGGRSGNTGEIYSQFNMGTVKIGHDVRGSSGAYSGIIDSLGSIARVTLGGSLIGGANDHSGAILSGGKLSGVTIGGSLVGGTSSNSGWITAPGNIGRVSIRGDLLGGDTHGTIVTTTGVIHGSRIASVTIGGSMLAGHIFSGSLSFSAAILADNDIGPIVIGGNLTGGDVLAVIAARGQLTPTAVSDIAIASLTVHGSVDSASILAGYSATLSPVNGNAQIGAVKVAGDWTGNLVAGAKNQFASRGDFGSNTDAEITAGSIGRIASITIGGSVADDPTSYRWGFVAHTIGAFKVGGAAYSLHSGAHNDVIELSLNTGNVTLREV